jgi:hypothetical protein
LTRCGFSVLLLFVKIVFFLQSLVKIVDCVSCLLFITSIVMRPLIALVRLVPMRGLIVGLPAAVVPVVVGVLEVGGVAVELQDCVSGGCATAVLFCGLRGVPGRSARGGGRR